MKKVMMYSLLLGLVACGQNDSTVDESQEKAQEESIEQLKQEQDVNVELEEIDGELDSLINVLN